MYVGHLQAVSNRAHWSQAVLVDDLETGEAAEFTRAALWVCRKNQPNEPVLTGSTDDAKLVATSEGFDIEFTPADMQVLEPGNYDVFIRLELASGQILQLVAANLPVVEGGPEW